MGWELSLLACIDYTVSCGLTFNLSSFIISAITTIKKKKRSALKGKKGSGGGLNLSRMQI